MNRGTYFLPKLAFSSIPIEYKERKHGGKFSRAEILQAASPVWAA